MAIDLGGGAGRSRNWGRRGECVSEGFLADGVAVGLEGGGDRVVALVGHADAIRQLESGLAAEVLQAADDLAGEALRLEFRRDAGVDLVVGVVGERPAAAGGLDDELAVAEGVVAGGGVSFIRAR